MPIEEFVYLLESNGLFKIGRTNDLTTRFSQYFSHNPFVARIIVLVTANSEALENHFLNIFSEKKVSITRDWYKLDPEDVKIFFQFSQGETINNYRPINRSIISAKITNNDETIEAEIIDFVKQRDSNQVTIIGEMHKRGYGGNRTRHILSSLERNNLIIVANGPKGSKIYKFRGK